jgi:putative Holliday junction resolvase
MNHEIPCKGRLGGVDYGTLRVGVAISNGDQTLASPHVNYQRQRPEQDANFFRGLAKQEELVGWVVGLPIHLRGDESQKSAEARQFGQWLQEQTGLPVAFVDERFSTAFAENLLQGAGLTSKQRKKRRDMLAAQIILTAFLESNRLPPSNQSLND